MFGLNSDLALEFSSTPKMEENGRMFRKPFGILNECGIDGSFIFTPTYIMGKVGTVGFKMVEPYTDAARSNETTT